MVSNVFIAGYRFYKCVIAIIAQLEIDDAAELTEDFLQDELHPKKILHRPVFAKPKGPPNRGAKRMTRPQAAAE